MRSSQRPRWGARVAGVLLVGLLTALGTAPGALASPPPTAAPDGVSAPGWRVAAPGSYAVSLRTVPYRDVADPQLEMDVYAPDLAPSGRPVLVLIHGGGYSSGDKSSWAAAARALAARGYVAVTLNYRLNTRPDGAWPAQQLDMNRALLWLRGHAGWWFADRTRIGVVGTSAGGHLALFAAGQPGVRAIAVWSPMLDVYDVAYRSRKGTPLAQDLITRTARCVYVLCPQIYDRQLRPPGYLNERPTVPVYAANSEHELIRTAPLRAFAARQRARGRVVTVDLVPGTAHAAGDAYGSVAWPGTLAHLARYL